MTLELFPARIRAVRASLTAAPVIAGLLAAAVIVLPRLVSAAPVIEDTAGIFSESARKEAAQIITEIERSTTPQKTVEIRTFDTLPAGTDVQHYSEGLFRDHRVNGVQIVVVKNPHGLAVTVGRATEARFHGKDELRSVLLSRFHEGKYDDGLLDGLRYLKGELLPAFSEAAAQPRRFSDQVNRSPIEGRPMPGNAGGGGFSIISMLFFVAVIFVILRLFRGAGRGFGAPGAPGYGGGGMFSNIMTGLFGAMAGNYVYDRFFRGGSSEAWGRDVSNPGFDPSGGANPSPLGGDDYGDVGSSSTGSWDDSSGGGGGGGGWGGGGDDGGGSSGGDW